MKQRATTPAARFALRFVAMMLASPFFLGGCVRSMVPGDLSRVQAYSAAPRAGNVYLLRGFIGIFSYGIDNIGRAVNRAGVRANVYQDDQASRLAEKIREVYANSKNPEPLILIGHSFGADDAIAVARDLRGAGISVDLLITLDPVVPPDVPVNVRWCYNIYQSNGVMDKLPFFRGIPLKADDVRVVLQNMDVRKDRTDLLEPGTDHFNIEKNPKIQADIVKQVLKVCPPRHEWILEQAARNNMKDRDGATHDVKNIAVDNGRNRPALIPAK